jgi:hypothetical protein
MEHKFGFHVNRTGADVLDAIRRLQPKVIKSVEHDVGFWKEVRTLLPDAFMIGRLVVAPEEQDQFEQDPAGTARAFAERILRLEANEASVQGRRLFDAWESYNEVMSGNASADRKRKYDDFQVAFAEPIRRAGFEPIAMNFGTGNMLGEDFVDLFPGTLETHTYLGFHEYDWPTMWRLHWQNIQEKDEGGMWLALRYRRIMDEVRVKYPNRHSVIITECGMTQGTVGGEDVGPWHTPSIPAEQVNQLKSVLWSLKQDPRFDVQIDIDSIRVDGPIPEEIYWDSLVWYNGEVMQDDYVMAALLFVVGAISPWESFEHLGGIMNRLEAHQNG